MDKEETHSRDVPVPPEATLEASVPARDELATDEPEQTQITIQLRNVKGDASFSVTCNANASVEQLRSAALASAPAEQKGPGTTAMLVFKGKVLQDVSASICRQGIGDGAAIVIIFKS